MSENPYVKAALADQAQNARDREEQGKATQAVLDSRPDEPGTVLIRRETSRGHPTGRYIVEDDGKAKAYASFEAARTAANQSYPAGRTITKGSDKAKARDEG